MDYGLPIELVVSFIVDTAVAVSDGGTVVVRLDMVWYKVEGLDVIIVWTVGVFGILSVFGISSKVMVVEAVADSINLTA